VKLHRLERIQRLETTPEEAWTFFSDPRNLPLITPPSLRFRMTSPLPEKMYAGMLITYTLTPAPLLRVSWVTEITHLEERRYFVDEQRFGPYRLWHHQHHFRPSGSGIEMTDIVTWGLPFLPGAELAAPFVARRLTGIFDFRRDYLEKRWGTER
jgi:ligand-binding SRPBCC domain-containing protein